MWSLFLKRFFIFRESFVVIFDFFIFSAFNPQLTTRFTRWSRDEISAAAQFCLLDVFKSLNCILGKAEQPAAGREVTISCWFGSHLTFNWQISVPENFFFTRLQMPGSSLDRGIRPKWNKINYSDNCRNLQSWVRETTAFSGTYLTYILEKIDIKCTKGQKATTIPFVFYFNGHKNINCEKSYHNKALKFK